MKLNSDKTLYFPDCENTRMFTEGLGYQQDVIRFACEYIKERHPERLELAVDIGAHVGITALNTLYFGFKKVIAFEPVHFDILKANALAYKANIDIYNIPLADKHCGVEFDQPRENNSGHIIPKETGGGSIAFPLDSFNLAPSFIKIDVEGFELRVLKGAKSTILKHRPYILFEAKGLGELEGNTNSPWEFLKNECGYVEKKDLDGANCFAIP